MTDRREPGPGNRWQQAHAELLQDSFRRLTGRSLPAADAGPDTARALYEAPFVVVSHDTQPDPVFDYANRCAQAVFEMDWEAFVRTPSRLSAEPVHRDARAALMTRVSRDGFIDDYRGIRVTATGRRFRIEQAVVWNLVDADGRLHGQAATFGHWAFLD